MGWQKKTVEISDKSVIDRLYNDFGHSDSAHAFQSIFIWKDDMRLSFCIGEDLYSVHIGNEEDMDFFFPVGNEESKRSFINGLIEKGKTVFNYLTEEDVSFLEESFPGRFEITGTPDDSEYLFDREAMEFLRGSVFAKKRNQVKRFLKEHEALTRSIAFDDIPVVKKIIAAWDRERHPGGVTDHKATLNMLDNMEELGLEGELLYLDGEPFAVIAGYAISEDTIDCCLQKARENMQGLSFYLRQQFAASFPSDIRTFNWEEDLGLPGLRRSKEIMHPAGKIDMYKAVLR